MSLTILHVEDNRLVSGADPEASKGEVSIWKRRDHRGYEHATQAPAARLMGRGKAACDRRADRNVADGRHYCLAGQEPVGTYRALHERKEPRTEVVRSFGVISSLTRFVAPAVWLWPASIRMVSPFAIRPCALSSASPFTIISSVVSTNSDLTGTTPHQRASRR